MAASWSSNYLADRLALDQAKAFKKDWPGPVETSDIKALRLELQELQGREQTLVQRESRLAGDLGAAGTKLTALNMRFDQIDRELSQTAEDSERKGSR
jgi:hypothetical protein